MSLHRPRESAGGIGRRSRRVGSWLAPLGSALLLAAASSPRLSLLALVALAPLVSASRETPISGAFLRGALVGVLASLVGGTALALPDHGPWGAWAGPAALALLLGGWVSLCSWLREGAPVKWLISGPLVFLALVGLSYAALGTTPTAVLGGGGLVATWVVLANVLVAEVWRSLRTRGRIKRMVRRGALITGALAVPLLVARLVGVTAALDRPLPQPALGALALVALAVYAFTRAPTGRGGGAAWWVGRSLRRAGQASSKVATTGAWSLVPTSRRDTQPRARAASDGLAST